MSKLSAQCDELRSMAVSVGLEMPQAATLMMEAANTIDRLEAENAKLRELIRDMWSEGMCECGSLGKCATCMYEYPTRMRELGVEP